MNRFDSFNAYVTKRLFLSGDNGCAREYEFAPRGDWTRVTTVMVVAIRDHLQGSNELAGDGVRLDQNDGDRTVRDSIVIEVSSRRKLLQNPQDRNAPDEIRIRGIIYTAIRRIAEDDEMEAWVFARQAPVNVKHGTRRG